MYADTFSFEIFWNSSKAEKSKDSKEREVKKKIWQTYKANKCTDNQYFLISKFLVIHRYVYTLTDSVPLKFPSPVSDLEVFWCQITKFQKYPDPIH